MIDGDRVVHEVRYPHPVRAVWHALTDPASLSAWLMPTDFAPAAGQRFRLDARPEFGFIDGEVVEIEPPHLIRCRWIMEGVPTTVTVRLRADGPRGTLLRLEHAGLPEGLNASWDGGWGAKLAHDLALVLAGTRDPARSRVEFGLHRHPDLAPPADLRPLWNKGFSVKTIHHVFDIDSDLGSVWAALTEPEQMAGWWSTKVTTPPAAVGARVEWTFAGDFNPVMEIIALDERKELAWRCVSGHEPWQDGIFRFVLASEDGGRTRLRFWQEYAVELADDYYGVYNFNWGYYLESLRLLCATGTGKPFLAGAY